MGFDNECIVNIQSLPGEYFCPVCRTLIYPNEALQSQCTHLYCKPCLAYIVATTTACPYDGYLVTEADSKPLIESNKALAETIDKVSVHCLYYRSGCQWQGTLSECTAHCTDCSFGNSLVVCNRCGTQIIHRQVQEHAQSCPGLQPQGQQTEISQAQASTVPNQAGTLDASSVASGSTTSAASASSSAAASASSTAAASVSTTSATAAMATPATTSAAIGQVQSQGNTAVQSQAVAQAPTPEQWYQQQQLQYQQYYQQYHGYDPYQQQYQQYGQYQQQVYQQYPQAYSQVPSQNVYQGQQQPVPYMVPQAQSHPQALHQSQPQPQPQQLPQSQPQLHTQPLAQPQLQSQAQPQVQQQLVPQPQTQLQPPPQHQPQPQPQPQPQSQPQPLLHAHPPQTQAQLHPQMQAQTYPLSHAQVPGQQMVQPQAQPQHPQFQSHPQPHQSQLAIPHPHHQHTMPPQQHSLSQMQPPQTHVQHQPPQQLQSQAHGNVLPQSQLQQPNMQLQPRPHSQPQPQAQPIPQLPPQQQHPSAQAVTGHQSYPQPQAFPQLPSNVPQQRPMQMHPQFHGPPQQRPQHLNQQPSQFPPQQPPQMRPAQNQLPGQTQQQPLMMQPQGPRPTHQQNTQLGQPLHHTGMRPPSQQQALPPHQMHGSMPVGQPHQQGSLPLQNVVLPPQSLRPPMQQHFASQPHPHLQQNVPLAQGIQTHQSPALSSKPTMLNHGMPQQAFQQGPADPPAHMQSGLNQQQAQLPPLDSHGSLVPESPAPSAVEEIMKVPFARAISKSTVSDSQGNVPGKAGPVLMETVTKICDGPEGSNSVSAEMKPPGHVADKAAGEQGKTVQNGEKQDIITDNESGQVPAKDSGLAKHELVGESKANPISEEVSSESQVTGVVGTHPKAAHGNKESQFQEGEANRKSGELVDGEVGHTLADGTAIMHPPLDSKQILQREILGSTSEKSDGDFVSQGQGKENMPKMQTQQMPGPTGLVGGKLQLQAHSNAAPGHGGSFPQPVYHDGNQQGVVPAAGPSFGQDRFPPHQVPRPALALQGPPQMPPSQERRFPEPPLQQMHTMASNQMRPPVHNLPESLPHRSQAYVTQDRFPPPQGRHPPGSFHHEAAHAGMSGTGYPNPTPSGLGASGLPLKNFEQHAGGPQGYNQSSIYHSSDSTARFPQGGPVAPPVLGGPPSGGFNSPSGLSARGPTFAAEFQVGLRQPTNHLDAEAYAMKRTDNFDSRHKPHGPSTDVQSNMMKMNGFQGKGPVGGTHDAVVSHGLMEDRFRPLPDERFKPLPEEGFKAAQEERFRHVLQDPGRHNADQREFGGDLKQFPHPASLDRDGMPKFEANMSSSGSLSRGPQPFGFDPLRRSLDRNPVGFDGGSSMFPSRPLPPYQGSHFPASSGGPSTFVSDGIGERHRPFGPQDNLIDARPDLLGVVPRFGRHHLDSLPPSRSPHREYAGVPFGKFGSASQSHIDEFDGRDLHGLGERFRAFNAPLDAPSSVFHENRVPKHLGSMPPLLRRGDPDARNLPILLRDGEPLGQRQQLMPEPTGFGGLHNHPRAARGSFSSHLGIGESIAGSNFPVHRRSSELGFGSSYPMHRVSFGDMDSFVPSRKRKLGSMGWCRICKIDCETVERLDLHCETREHQKVAIDLALSIKQENAKKLKTSGDSFSQEDSIKSKSSNFENHGNKP